VKYGLPVKDSAVTDYFNKGLGADKVPFELLEDYLNRDVFNTHQIAEKQMAEATEKGMLDLIISQMEAIHATTEMMYNGLAVDMDYYKTYAAEVAIKFADNETILKDYLGTLVGSDFYPIEDINSSLQWSKFFFGGIKKVDSKEVVGLYKNGKPKTKKVTALFATTPFSDVAALDEWKSEKTGKVSVDEKVLTYINTSTKETVVKEITNKLLQHRDLTKQLSTYVQGLSKHVIDHGIEKEGQYCIHGRLTHVSTSTGRLSSSSPNLQNISNNPIKKIFCSRYGIEGGSLVEFDFSQLEVAVLAHVTKDRQLITDISTGKDIHTELYKDMFHVEPTKDERKRFKRLTFGLIYGAGAKTLSVQAGCTLDVAKKFVVTFYARYPEVRGWNTSMENVANLKGVHITTPEGLTSITRQWKHISETKRIYTFNEYKSKYEGTRDYTFSPTELKNYPVQGLATGDIVPLMLGVVFRELVSTSGVKLINTIHDSILLDCSMEAVEAGVIEKVQRLLERTHEYYKATFGIPLALKLSAGVSSGKNWFEMEEI
jgi:DNA polymerase I-like protein with 3'-5' exonuclease and polymerase domains